MIPLYAHGVARGITRDLLGKVSMVPVMPQNRHRLVRVFAAHPSSEELEGYVAVLTPSALLVGGSEVPMVAGCATDHLLEGDVVSITPSGQVRTLYRRGSTSNSLFATDRCNSLCLMCSQPPRDVDDSGRAEDLIRLIELIDPETSELGITGGEPTLLGQGLLDVIAACRDRLPETALHVLSNGRRFYYARYANALAAVRHPDLMIGVPVYSDIGDQHDYIVQARRAFDETIIGLCNLGRSEVPTEIRVVVHRHTYQRLPKLAEFIYRNLTFASHVTFMGLEVIGFGKTNAASLWVDPLDYAGLLEEAVLMLGTAGMNVSIYNHQLCTLPPSIWSYCRQSISDWKNEYASECSSCGVKEDCGGFFAWNLDGYRSRGIRPVVADLLNARLTRP